MKKLQKRTKMKGVVLTAGTGARLTEVTKYIPKTMIQIRGKYIFEMIVESLINVGITDIIFVVGYKHKQLVPLIQKKCKDLGANITFVVNHRYNETNTMYSLWLARDHLNCPFVYLHGDLLFRTQMLKEFIFSNHRNAVLVDKKFPLDWDDAMKVIIHGGGIKYMSKAITVNEMDGIAIGIYMFDSKSGEELFEIVERLIKKDVVESWISEAINILTKTVNVEIVENNDHPWIDIDNLADLNMASNIYESVLIQ